MEGGGREERGRDGGRDGERERKGDEMEGGRGSEIERVKEGQRQRTGESYDVIEVEKRMGGREKRGNIT